MFFDDKISDAKAKADYHRTRDQMATLLQDANNMVIKTLEMLQDRPIAKNHAAAFLLARHLIEMMDGVGVLLSSGCAEAAKPLLRSALEAAMSMLYVVKEDSDRRNLALQLSDAHKRIKLYLRYDKNSEQGKAFDREMAGDTMWTAMKPQRHDFPQLIKNLEKIFVRPQFVPIEAEWKRLKALKKGDPYWYSFFSTLGNIKDLAKAVNMRGEYEFLYRQWSESVHGGNAMLQVKRVGEAKPDAEGNTPSAMVPLRNPEAMQTCVLVGVALCLKVGLGLVTKYAPDQLDSFRAKYIQDIQGRYLGLMDAGKLINVNW
jgi:hypothetical protein